MPSFLGVFRPVLAGRCLVTGLLLSGALVPAVAQVVTVPATPQIGSANPMTAEPPVARPGSRPCTVPLFTNLEFADFNLKSFNYTPPAACPGPWAKVVFTADFTVTAGNQFDRTAAFYLGHANIYYGTTAEPGATLSPSWHVERDVTDLTALFQSAQVGEANLGNFVGVSGGVTYNGIIYANAALQFYPATGRDRAPRTADLVVPVEGGGGDAGTLNTTASQITQVLNLPTNVESAYLDVIAQSQSGDEFWYFCVPGDQTANLESCGNTAFRETEISIDGQPAGVAPVYPWIYTGGIDPFLWQPIPGVQTLDFKPYRVDLTPFAGLLSDGAPHTVAVSVFNANSYFLATANLLVFTDHGGKKVTGGILRNTLTAAPTPVVTETISTTGGGAVYAGGVLVTSQRAFEITGYVDTSHGHVETTLRQQVKFSSNQTFNVDPSAGVPDIQSTQQLTTVDSQTITGDGRREHFSESHSAYPLTISYALTPNADGTYTQVTTTDQQDHVKTLTSGPDFDARGTELSNEVHSTDTLSFDANFNFLGNTGNSSTQTYVSRDAQAGCYSRTLQAAGGVLTAVQNQKACRE